MEYREAHIYGGEGEVITRLAALLHAAEQLQRAVQNPTMASLSRAQLAATVLSQETRAVRAWVTRCEDEWRDGEAERRQESLLDVEIDRYRDRQVR